MKEPTGEEIQMWVHYPPDFDESKEYPLFLLIHGGPHSGITDGFHFRWNAQTFASWGYVTAWHNFHGSSGIRAGFYRFHQPRLDHTALHRYHQSGRVVCLTAVD
jgi:dipeptidyl aminopeptidase/acylaminoacyl peptidase